MRFLRTITSRALVWLAAAMIPWQGLPGMACACVAGGPHPTGSPYGSVAVQEAPDAPGAGGQCLRCPRQASAGSSCCKRSDATAPAASSVSRSLRCGCDWSCTCCGPCVCRRDRPTAPPLPAAAGPEANKTFSAPADSLVAAAIDLRAGTGLGRGLRQFSPSVPTSLERLSALCRFLI